MEWHSARGLNYNFWYSYDLMTWTRMRAAREGTGEMMSLNVRGYVAERGAFFKIGITNLAPPDGLLPLGGRF